MSEESLKALVAGLRSQLAQAHDLDADAREDLHSLALEVETASPFPDSGQQKPRCAIVWPIVRELEVSREASKTVSIVDTLAFYTLAAGGRVRQGRAVER
jgi:hypothetical protein